MKHIILCADDYGQNSPISQAILALIQQQKLSATSCMVTSAEWPIQAVRLKRYQNQVDIGLHFNLTEQIDGAYSLSNIIVSSLLRRLNKDQVMTQLNTQIDQFLNEMGCLPDYIDGHQHIHHLPVVRDALFEVYEQRLRASGCYLRSVYDQGAKYRIRAPGYLKNLILQWTGAVSFKMQLLQRKIPHNASFSGIYEFSAGVDYRSQFLRFLTCISDNGLIMCHPCNEATDPADRIATARYKEYQYFASEQFETDCKRADVKIGRFNK